MARSVDKLGESPQGLLGRGRTVVGSFGAGAPSARAVKNRVRFANPLRASRPAAKPVKTRPASAAASSELSGYALTRDGVALHLVDEALPAQAEHAGGLLLVVPVSLQGLGDHPLLHLRSTAFLADCSFRPAGRGRLASAGSGRPSQRSSSSMTLPRAQAASRITSLRSCRTLPGHATRSPDCASPRAKTPWRRVPSPGSTPAGSDWPAAGSPRGSRAAAACGCGSP